MRNSFNFFKLVFGTLLGIMAIGVICLIVYIKTNQHPSNSIRHSIVSKRNTNPTFRSFKPDIKTSENSPTQNQDEINNIISEKMDFAFKVFNLLQVKKDDSVNYGQLSPSNQDTLNSNFVNRDSFTELVNLLNVSHLQPTEKLKKQVQAGSNIPNLNYKINSLSSYITNDDSNSYTCAANLTYKVNGYKTRKVKVYFELDKTTNQITQTSDSFITN